jgi:hypothetical protein
MPPTSPSHIAGMTGTCIVLGGKMSTEEANFVPIRTSEKVGKKVLRCGIKCCIIKKNRRNE